MPGYREITLPGEGRRPRTVVAPARGRVVARDWRAVLGSALTGTADLCLQSPGTVLGSLAGLGAAGFICFNALSHQAGPHPAPILPKLASPASPAQKAALPRPVAQAESAPAKETARTEVRTVPTASPKQAARDPIGEIIRSDETTASVTPRAEPKVAKAATPEASVMQAQRALSKLGYGSIKPDGLMGPGTRAAIETFERKSKLPVTGKAAGKTLKELVSRAAQG